MSLRPPRARIGVVSFVLLSAFLGLTVASPTFAAAIPDAVAASDATVASTQPPTQQFLYLEPSLSPALIGLGVAQTAAQAPRVQSPTQRAPATHAVASIDPAATRPRGLVALYASYAVLQALDVHSTLTAVRGGAIEQNPVAGPLVNRPAGFVAVKAATTAGAIIAVDRLSRHNRVVAYALMFALNSAYTFVVVHNYRVAGR